MKKIVGLLSLLLLLGACSNSQKKEPQLVGNSKDDHGCLLSAGYQWSEALKDCVRIWEVGEKLLNVDDDMFVIFSPDSSVAEVFVGKGEKYMCKRTSDGTLWKSPKKEVSVALAHGSLSAHFKKKVFSQEAQ